MLWRAAAVSVNATAMPIALAVSLFAPAEGPRVRVTAAMPLPFVVGEVEEIDPPPRPNTQVTGAPGFGLLCPSFTSTLCAVGKALFTIPT